MGVRRATHIDYQHPGHLRVETGEPHSGWSLGRGFYTTTAICMAPSCSEYAKLKRPGLPKWEGGE